MVLSYSTISTPSLLKQFFTTAHPKYAIDAIKHAAFDYLLKPVNIVELREVLNRYLLKQVKKSKRKKELKKIIDQSGRLGW